MNFNSKVWIKIPLPSNFQVQSILRAHVNSLSWTASQSLKYYLFKSCFFFITLSRKIIRKNHTVKLDSIVEPHNASWLPIPLFERSSRLCARGWKTLQIYGFPIQTSKCHNLNSKVWIKILLHQISRCDPFMWTVWHEHVRSQSLKYYLINYLNSLNFST